MPAYTPLYPAVGARAHTPHLTARTTWPLGRHSEAGGKRGSGVDVALHGLGVRSLNQITHADYYVGAPASEPTNPLITASFASTGYSGTTSLSADVTSYATSVLSAGAGSGQYLAIRMSGVDRGNCVTRCDGGCPMHRYSFGSTTLTVVTRPPSPPPPPPAPEVTVAGCASQIKRTLLNPPVVEGSCTSRSSFQIGVGGSSSRCERHSSVIIMIITYLSLL